MYLPTDNLKTFMEQNPETYKGLFPEENRKNEDDENVEETSSSSDKILDKSQNKK